MHLTYYLAILAAVLLSVRVGIDPDFPPASVEQSVGLCMKYVFETPYVIARATRSTLERAAGHWDAQMMEITMRASRDEYGVFWSDDWDRVYYNLYSLARTVTTSVLEPVRVVATITGAAASGPEQSYLDEQAFYCQSRGGCRDAIAQVVQLLKTRYLRPPTWPPYFGPGDEERYSDTGSSDSVLMCSPIAVYTDVSMMKSFLQRAGISEGVLLIDGDYVVGAGYAQRKDDVADMEMLLKHLHVGDFVKWTRGRGEAFYKDHAAADLAIMEGIEILYNGYVHATQRSYSSDELFGRMMRALRRNGVDTSRSRLQPVYVCKLEHWLDLTPMADTTEDARVGELEDKGTPLHASQLMLSWLVYEGYVEAHEAWV